MTKSSTKHKASIVSSLVVAPCISNKCLFTENPLSGSALPCESMIIHFAKALSLSTFSLLHH